MAIGAFCNLLTEANGFSRLFPGITPYLLSLKLMHYFPLYREYVMSLGVCDVSKESITHIMKGRGVAATIVIGKCLLIGGLVSENEREKPGQVQYCYEVRLSFVKVGREKSWMQSLV